MSETSGVRTELPFLAGRIENPSDPVDPAQVRAMLARVPPSWLLVKHGEDGAMFQRGSIQVITSLGNYDGQLWLHVSACGRAGQGFTLPSWDALKRVKHDFIGENQWAYQVFPPNSQWVNDHPCVLHMFSLFDNRPALPDFTRGQGTL